MLPKKTTCTTSTLSAPGCGDLPVERAEEDGRPVFNSRWEISDEEREAIAAGGEIELTIWGMGHPPVALSVVDAEDTGTEAPAQ